MEYMFNECSKLKSLPNLSKWNLKNLINNEYMFNKCSSLISIPKLSK